MVQSKERKITKKHDMIIYMMIAILALVNFYSAYYFVVELGRVQWMGYISCLLGFILLYILYKLYKYNEQTNAKKLSDPYRK
ncbi:hypothetical protein [Abyssicoccus albus]|uniref:Uncharacterized protein n=1 Tax=Abyssicoccus albus TaxID=1817405 RepID=A0A3N5BBA8_9BACL|nr:hypothetical protein [Abyssicoccus albus]RPF54804.1 hypothetical protein EDD62_1581 [Abyssicoccus albus]